MINLIPLLNFELRKISNRKKYWIIPIFEILFLIATSICSVLYPRIPFLNFSVNVSNQSLSVLPVFLIFLLPITIFMLVSDVYSSEFENNSMKNLLSRPISRFTIFAGKGLSIIVYIFINLLLVLFTTIFLQLAIRNSTYNISIAIVSYILSVFPMTVFVFFSAFIANLVTSSSMCMFLLVVIYLLISGLSLYSSAFSSVVFTNYLSYYTLFLGNVKSMNNILNITFLMLSNLVLFFMFGYFLFDKKEV